jgi:hypothetical protein
MARLLVTIAVALLLTNRAWAQSEANCEEIRQAVATYGYEEARRHAMIHYGAEAVEAGEKKCLAGEIPTKPIATKASLTKPAASKPLVKHQQPKKRKPTAASVQPRHK